MTEGIQDLVLLPHQYRAVTSPKPRKGLVTGLGGGKTWIGARWLISRAMQFPRSIHLATSNSIPQAHDVVIPALLRAFEDLELEVLHNKTRNVFFLDLGGGELAEIRVRSTDHQHVNKLRGPEYGSWWGDEVRDCTPYAATLVKGRLRCTKVDRPELFWTTTPNGYDHIWEMFVNSADDRCELIQAHTRDNVFGMEGYADELARDLDSDEYEQEAGGGFVVLGAGAVYRRFERDTHISKAVCYDHTKPLILGLDYGASPQALIVMQQQGEDTDSEIHALDEITAKGEGLAWLAAQLASRFSGHYAGIRVYDDAASAKNRTPLGSKTLRAEFKQALEKYFDNVWIHSKLQNPDPIARHSVTNAVMRNHRGDVRYRVHPRCKELVKDYQQCRYKDGTQDIDKRDQKRTHHSDAAGYPLFWLYRHRRFEAEPGYGTGKGTGRNEPRRRRRNA